MKTRSAFKPEITEDRQSARCNRGDLTMFKAAATLAEEGKVDAGK